MTAPTLIRGLSDDEVRLIGRLLDKLRSHESANFEARAYYEAKQLVRHMGIAIPQEVAAKIAPVVGWGGTAVDVVEERIDWLGWTVYGDGDDLGMQQIYDDNRLAVESGFAHLDTLMLGTSFVRVGTGSEGEPSPLVTPHAADTTTGDWNARTRRLDSAVTVTGVKDGAITDLVLDVPGQTITCTRRGGQWVVAHRDEHGLSRVPVVALPNRPRGSRRMGRSEITHALRYYCDAAVRTLLGMEANREFYSIPQLALLNRGQEAFVDKSGNLADAWKILAGHLIAMSKDDEGDAAQIEQLNVSSPEPFIAQARQWAQLLSAEAGIPTSYLGFHTDNPSSADAIRAGEARLVKRVERRQTTFGIAWLEVGELALRIRDGAAPEDYWSRVSSRWAEASTPTRAAQADAGMKQLSAIPWLADTETGLELLGLTDQQIKRAMAERRRSRGDEVIAQLVAAAGGGAGSVAG